jgi:hypothetical protein
LLVHPLVEGDDQRWIASRGLSDQALNETGGLQVSEEQASAVQYLQPERVAEVWTPASSAKVAIEALERRFTRPPDLHAGTMCPVHKVLR